MNIFSGFFRSQKLLRNPNFMKLWAGETISQFGTQITILALPLTAILVLDASPLQMGIISAIEFMPMLLLTLFAGVWVDRMNRRFLLITTNIGRAVVLGSVPVLALLNILNIEYLYIVAFLLGSLSVIFDVAYQSYLPLLVEPEDIIEGNSKLESTRSLAQITGAGIAGGLVQLVTAPVAIAIDSVSFLFSIFFLVLIRKPEPTHEHAVVRKSIWKEILEGLQLIIRSKILYSIALYNGSINFFASIIGTVFTLYAIDSLNITPGVLGIIVAIAGIGSLIGAIFSSQIARRFGPGYTIIGSGFLYSFGAMLFPLLQAPVAVVIPLLMLGNLIQNVSILVFNITQISLRQAITVPRLQGRMNASMRFVICSLLPVGSLTGGALGEWIGLRSTLVVGSIGLLMATVWLYFSPLRQLREYPSGPAEEPAEGSSVVASY